MEIVFNLTHAEVSAACANYLAARGITFAADPVLIESAENPAADTSRPFYFKAKVDLMKMVVSVATPHVDPHSVPSEFIGVSGTPSPVPVPSFTRPGLAEDLDPGTPIVAPPEGSGLPPVRVKEASLLAVSPAAGSDPGAQARSLSALFDGGASPSTAMLPASVLAFRRTAPG